MAAYDQIYVNSVSGSVNMFGSCYIATGAKGIVNTKITEVGQAEDCVFCYAITGVPVPLPSFTPTNTPDPSKPATPTPTCTVTPTITPTITPTATTP